MRATKLAVVAPPVPKAGSRSTLGRYLAAAGVLAVCLFGLREYVRIVHAAYPVDEWLFWKLAQLWAWSALFSVACVSAGQRVLVRVLGLWQLPALESAVQSMAIGVVVFTLAMYVGGAVGWYGPVFAVALPLALLAFGAQDGLRLLRALRIEEGRSARGPVSFALTGAGVLCVALVYLGAMTPDALNYDSTWCHLVVAQDYARSGRIVAFPADYTRNVPQLASLIHTWDFTLPGLDWPLRWMMALQSEFALFVWTLAGVAAAVRMLVRDPRLSGSWAAFFLFPIIFVYDHNIGAAADHVCAFFAVPILLATLRLCAGFRRGPAALLAIAGAGAFLTKYQAVYVLVPVALVVAGFWLRQLWLLRAGAPAALPARELWVSPLVAAGLFVVLISPPLIRQTVFHHNPLYPFLQNVFRGSTPTLPGAALLFANTTTDPNWVPPGTLGEKLLHASKLFFSFSFEPHYSFHGTLPVFGSLFTLLLPLIAFVESRARLLVAIAISSGALLIWGIVYNVDRNLQIFMPLMVCVTAGLIAQAWRLGSLARLGVAALLALQIVWGADIMFNGGQTRVQSAFELIHSGIVGHAQTRFDGYRSTYRAIDRALPPRARVLLHTSHISLGIDREIWLDWIGFQALISYTKLHTARELFDYYRRLGITHLLFEPGARPAGTKQEEVLWNAFVRKHADRVGDFGGYRLLAMPRVAPPAAANYRVATLGLAGYADGIYPIERLSTDEYLPLSMRRFPAPQTALPDDGKQRAVMLEDVDAIFIGPHPPPSATSRVLRKRFDNAVQYRDQFTLYLKTAAPAPTELEMGEHG